MDIYKEDGHRPLPLPPNNWIMRQAWRDVLFLHWPVQPEQLRPFIPSELEIDTYDGSAWIGIVAFAMEGIYFRGLSFFSVVTPFSEMNVRTYVKHKGKPGVFFISLDVNDWASLNIAKRWYRLPYHSADISIRPKGSTIYYESIRKNQPVRFEGTCTAKQEEYFPVNGTLDHFLTEKYCFYTACDKINIFYGDIHHPPWPLQRADFQIQRNTLFSPLNLDFSDETPIVHFSKGVDSLMWNVKKLKKL
ncbi:MAG TPA: DUF2071 domain-containing protein [Bacillus bacterium]|uniref:YqjF family protein n=1 Tax=Siminovitchia fordii TaxID=254759 RepID=UPI000366AD49|nr:DUF2071 domain-containing protein [Siminovitchia fordii]HBZ08711.1 DUF2071 domain-containing protein [Bacillus sp. (in: firmicutes)]